MKLQEFDEIVNLIHCHKVVAMKSRYQDFVIFGPYYSPKS